MPGQSNGNTPRVAVVGAGVAGLTAAYTMQKQGYEVEVFECEVIAGGRMRSERHGDYVIERRAQFIASSYRNMALYTMANGLVPFGTLAMGTSAAQFGVQGAVVVFALFAFVCVP